MKSLKRALVQKIRTAPSADVAKDQYKSLKKSAKAAVKNKKIEGAYDG